MYYLIEETLVECRAEDLFKGTPYVAVLTPEEWKQGRDNFGMGIDMELGFSSVAVTKAVVNYDSLTGIISVPRMGYDDHESGAFRFALDERGIVFIDGGTLALHITQTIASTKRWRLPSLERFLYDFLEYIIDPDLVRLGGIEQELEKLEKEILEGDSEKVLPMLNEIRGNLLDMELHYGQLMDLGQELEENENDFFAEENLRYFNMFTVRAGRLCDMVMNLRDYSVQLRDLIQTRVDVKQNRIMTLLTVVTTIFAPLTLLTGWYGMNFRHMPELEYKWSYPAVLLVSIAISVGCIIYFKKKKWM